MNNLRDLLNLERVLVASKIAKGTYDQDENRIKLLTFSGKWDMGYFEDNIHYLRPHEALHLMEMGRLEVTFDTVVMSIEQAYAIFLSQGSEVSFEEYVVFSYLNRIGYHVSLHDRDDDWIKPKEYEERKYEDNEEKMIFYVLMERLNQPVPESFLNEEKKLYEETKRSINLLNECICGQREHEVAGNSDEPSSKRLKLDNEMHQKQNFLDVLKSETGYKTYQEIFNKFSCIKRTEKFPASTRELNFTFEVFTPKPNMKKAEKIPSYRIVVVK